MTTRTITITDTAYRLLASHKESKDSFSDVIVKSFGGSSLLDLVGVLKKGEADKMRAAIAAGRRSMDEEAARAAKRMR